MANYNENRQDIFDKQAHYAGTAYGGFLSQSLKDIPEDDSEVNSLAEEEFMSHMSNPEDINYKQYLSIKQKHGDDAGKQFLTEFALKLKNKKLKEKYGPAKKAAVEALKTGVGATEDSALMTTEQQLAASRGQSWTTSDEQERFLAEKRGKITTENVAQHLQGDTEFPEQEQAGLPRDDGIIGKYLMSTPRFGGGFVAGAADVLRKKQKNLPVQGIDVTPANAPDRQFRQDTKLGPLGIGFQAEGGIRNEQGNIVDEEAGGTTYGVNVKAAIKQLVSNPEIIKEMLSSGFERGVYNAAHTTEKYGWANYVNTIRNDLGRKAIESLVQETGLPPKELDHKLIRRRAAEYFKAETEPFIEDPSMAQTVSDVVFDPALYLPVDPLMTPIMAVAKPASRLAGRLGGRAAAEMAQAGARGNVAGKVVTAGLEGFSKAKAGVTAFTDSVAETFLHRGELGQLRKFFSPEEAKQVRDELIGAQMQGIGKSIGYGRLREELANRVRWSLRGLKDGDWEAISTALLDKSKSGGLTEKQYKVYEKFVDIPEKDQLLRQLDPELHQTINQKTGVVEPMKSRENYGFPQILSKEDKTTETAFETLDPFKKKQTSSQIGSDLARQKEKDFSTRVDKQWMAKFNVAGRGEGISKELLETQRIMSERGMSVVGDSAEAAVKATELQKKTGMKLTKLEGNVADEFLRIGLKPGEKASGKAVYVPDFIAKRVNDMYAPPKVKGLAAQVASKVWNEGMATMRATTTIAMPAFHIMNAMGAAEMSFVAHGMRAADPKLQFGAALGGFAAAVNKDPHALKIPFKLSGGETIPLGKLIQLAESHGVMGLGHLRYGGKNTGPISSAINLTSKYTGVAALGDTIDNYQHLVAFAGALKSTGKDDVLKAALFADKYSGNYALMSKAGEKLKDFGAFYSWAHFALPYGAKMLKEHPQRLAVFNKIKEHLNRQNTEQTPQAAMFDETKPEWAKKRVIAMTGAKDVQPRDGEAGEQDFVMSMLDSPTQTLNDLIEAPKDFIVGQGNMGVQAAAILLLGGRDPRTNEDLGLPDTVMKKIGWSVMPRLSKASMDLFNYYLDNEPDAALRLALELRVGNSWKFMTEIPDAFFDKNTRWSWTGQNQLISPDLGQAYRGQKRYDEVKRAEEKAAKSGL